MSWQDIKNHFPEDYARGVEESNQRKFERDKAELISLGIPIEYHSGPEIKKEGYFIDKEKFFLPEIEFTPQESSLLMLTAAAMRENEGFPYREQLDSALHKITSVQHQTAPPPSEISIRYSSGEKRSPRAAWIDEIQDALDRRKTIDITYHAFSTGEVTRRKVNSYGLIFRRGNWTLVGWDHLRQDIRSFVLTRIKHLTVNRKRPGTADYEIPDDFSMKRYQNQQPWQFVEHEPLEVTIRVSRHRLPELLPQLSQAARLGEQTFKLNVTNRSGLLSWALSQKTDVQILEPPEIRDQICEVLQGLL